MPANDQILEVSLLSVVQASAGLQIGGIPEGTSL